VFVAFSIANKSYQSPFLPDVLIHSRTVHGGSWYCEWLISFPKSMGMKSAHIIVDIRSPSGVDLDSSVPILGHSCHKRPHFIDLSRQSLAKEARQSRKITCPVHQNRASIITDHVNNTRVRPRPKRIPIVQARNGRWNETGCAKFVSPSNTTLYQPGLIPGNLSCYIEIGSIVLIFVCKRVRYMTESIEIGWICPPGQQII
jgi:hypothetical protein